MGVGTYSQCVVLEGKLLYTWDPVKKVRTPKGLYDVRLYFGGISWPKVIRTTPQVSDAWAAMNMACAVHLVSYVKRSQVQLQRHEVQYNRHLSTKYFTLGSLQNEHGQQPGHGKICTLPEADPKLAVHKEHKGQTSQDRRCLGSEMDARRRSQAA